MSVDWKNVVDNPDEQKVIAALADPKWDYRTVDGIYRATGLSRDQIDATLAKYEGQIVRKSSIPDAEGRDLYTLNTDRSETQDTLSKLRTFISKSVR